MIQRKIDGPRTFLQLWSKHIRMILYCAQRQLLMRHILRSKAYCWNSPIQVLQRNSKNWRHQCTGNANPIIVGKFWQHYPLACASHWWSTPPRRGPSLSHTRQNRIPDRYLSMLLFLPESMKIWVLICSMDERAHWKISFLFYNSFQVLCTLQNIPHSNVQCVHSIPMCMFYYFVLSRGVKETVLCYLLFLTFY